MKYLSLPSFDVVTSALNFDTPDCHVTGSCDLYTTKAAGSDKKLYKNIQQSLESQHAALLKLGKSLSPPQRESMAASLNLSRSSPFGSLDQMSNRRTFAYLIATLNASHPDYDFSHVLRPADFKRERSLSRVMTQIDSTLSSVRPNSTLLDVAVPRGSPAKATDFNTGVSTAPAWGPQMWAMIDKEMVLKDCIIFSYQPADDPFDEEEGAIWALHYFFFNKALKRVCYLYVRGVPVMSHSPRLLPHSALSRRARTSLSGIGDDDSDDVGANKRARYWLGDRFAERVTSSDDDMDDGLVWNRDADGDVSYQYDDDDDEDYSDEFGQEDEDQAAMEMDGDEEPIDKQRGRRESFARGVSEDIAGRMEIDV
ncbi:Maf1 regulator-domain-containing protein [Chaetomium strumarium]|uniref:Repressor of RNA polymerase III transcription MAF1 n=1 Tax=Chaetomium strumarium TaxID=1170767 RepID=A0AAJ0GZU7_9PEZI|nr:Maf1 regulator-domain-containing protein [Chaetomium strumarium]